jgi:hypothetical protein
MDVKVNFSGKQKEARVDPDADLGRRCTPSHLRQDREMDGVESGTGTVWSPGAPVSLHLKAKAVDEEHVARKWHRLR